MDSIDEFIDDDFYGNDDGVDVAKSKGLSEEDSKIGRYVHDVLGLQSVYAVLDYFNWGDLGGGYFIRPESTSGSKSGQIHQVADGRVGITIKTPEVTTRDGRNIKLSKIDWWSATSLWVLLEHGNNWKDAAREADQDNTGGCEFDIFIDDTTDQLSLPPVKNKHTAKDDENLQAAKEKHLLINTKESLLDLLCTTISLGYPAPTPEPPEWQEAVKLYKTRKKDKLVGKKPKAQKAPPVVGPTNIQVNTDVIIADTNKLITGFVPECYSYAGVPGYIYEGSFVPFDTAARLGRYLNDRGVEFFSVAVTGKLTYVTIPKPLGDGWLAGHDLPTIELFTHTPTLNLQWGPTMPGYNADKSYYLGNEIQRVQGQARLNELLDCFCLKTNSDRTNLIGTLIGCVLSQHFGSAGKPGLIISGQQVGLGKTTLGKTIASLMSGKPCTTIGLDKNDEKTEKELASCVLAGDTSFLFDNIKGVIESALIERSMSDEVLSFRRLGGNKLVRVQNSHLWMFSANTPSVGADILSRCVTVELFLDVDPKSVVYTVQPLDFVREHREEILGEIINMILEWHEAGAVVVPTPHRFKVWSEIVGGVLSHAGYQDFLTNQNDLIVEMNPEAAVRLAACEKIAWKMKPGKYYNATQLLPFTEATLGTPRQQSTALGITISHNLNTPFVREIAGVQETRILLRHGKKELPNVPENRDGVVYSVVEL